MVRGTLGGYVVHGTWYMVRGTWYMVHAWYIAEYIARGTVHEFK